MIGKNDRPQLRQLRGTIQVDIRKGLVDEAAGGKVISFYVTTGESDFLLISEADESEAIIASLMTAAAAGTISDVSTGRAWTGAEFKAIMERASKAAKSYRPPGKKR